MTDLQRVAAEIRGARRVTALTGAGVSAASGIPTFRGADGLWKKVRAETLATPEAFENDPKLVWEWYDWRRQSVAGAQPNPAHDVLAKWTRERPGFTLITQNVDGLHEKAGAERLVRLHGSIWHVRCYQRCDAGQRDWRDDTTPLPTLPPRCPHCGGIVRPGVVWFGEGLDPDDVARATEASECDLFLTIGTSAVVYPAAGLVHQAKRRGAFTVEINLESTDASRIVDVGLRGQAAEILTSLDVAIRGRT
ncbi:MAG TPA: NAD-dependent deacylase [Vicinamibacterales bacterium]|nr:NAD-dependent deacylase [Vicinamibacterales bacterium]